MNRFLVTCHHQNGTYARDYLFESKDDDIIGFLSAFIKSNLKSLINKDLLVTKIKMNPVLEGDPS